MAESILFTEEFYPNVIKVANELAEIERRKPTDSLKILITEEGRKKIDRLKLEKGIQ